MKLTIVGSGTAAPTPERVCSGYWVETREARVLLDCGAGVVHGMARLELPWDRLDHLLITHFHNDHIGDVPMLFFALKHGVRPRRTAPLTIWAPHGMGARLTAMTAAFGDHVADPGFPVVIREVRPGAEFAMAGLRVTSIATPHTAESLAFRIEQARGAGARSDGEYAASLGYTGDTGPSEEVAVFLAGVDVLIAECSLPDEEAIPTHLSPSSLAALTSRASPGKLVVTHVYPQLEALGPLARLRAAGWSGPMVRAEDGLTLEP